MKEIMQNLKKVYRYTKEYNKYLFTYMIIIPIMSAISIVVPLLSARELAAITSGTYTALFTLAIFVFCIEILRNVCNYIAWFSLMKYFRESERVMKMKALRAVFGIKNKNLDGMPSGLIIERVNSDCNKISDAIPSIVEYLLDIITNLGVIVTIFFLNKILFAFLLVGAAGIFCIKRQRIKKWHEFDKQRRHLSERVTSFISELIRGVRDIKVLDANESFLNTAEDKIKDYHQTLFKGRRSLRRYEFISGSLQDLLDYTFIVLGIILLRDDLVTATAFVTVFLYKERIYNMFNVYTRLQELFQDFKLSSSRVLEIIDGDRYERETFGTKTLDNIKGDFEFKNVTFGYKDKIPVLKNMSFKVDANTTVGFVGKSGTGKTTVFNLLAKLYEPEKGNIYIDGVNIDELDEHSIRGNMTIINQSPYIFNMSIYDNLKLVNPKATKKEIKEACKIACLDEFIESLPEKYDSIVGEGGIALSGGQRQRLAIARALVQHTEIILFDEATSALDNETQKSIQEAIDNMKGEYTIMIIAHRFSTIINCDTIFYMEDGCIKAKGTHKELLKTCDGYKKLYELELKNNV